MQLHLQNNEKSPCKIDVYVAPPTFSLALRCPPTFFILESPLGARNNFSIIFYRGAKSGYIFYFSHWKLRKQPFLLKFSKTQDGHKPLPTPMFVNILFFHYWQNVFAGRIQWFRGPVWLTGRSLETPDVKAIATFNAFEKCFLLMSTL